MAHSIDPKIRAFWDIPPKSWIKRLHTNGTKVWVQVGSVEQAVEAVRVGADAIIAQGSEAGGHNRTIVALSSLVSAVVDAIASLVPVIAAGAIADGRTVASALALGAEGVCVGTRLIASREAYAHEEYKRVNARVGTTSIFGRIILPVNCSTARLVLTII